MSLHTTSFERGLACAIVIALAACGGDTGDTGETAAAGADTMAAAPATGETPATDALTDPNEASPEQLAALPGLDSATVAAIIDGRPFDDMVTLNARLSERMDSTQLDGLYRRMFIPLDLNTASEEEILLIPGVGPRMAHEFEEYRPYRGIAQFRREIGKYVDDDEVARLERYVVIR